MGLDWSQFAQWLFLGCLTGIAMYVARSIERLRKSVEKLNTNVAVIIEKTTNHEKRITKLENKKLR